MKPLVIAGIGNYRPSHSSENHFARSLESLGHTVVPLQEDEERTWDTVALSEIAPDLVMWTRTWHLPQFDQSGLLDWCKRNDVPTVFYHLDRWWGLEREHQVHDEPCFRCDLVVTADGGHDAQWAEAGVNHLWMPPGVVEDECGPGTPWSAYKADVAFLGSTQTYHAEWFGYRRELFYKLRSRYRQRFRTFPRPGQRQIRGADLADLFASVKVMIGDSCLAGGQTRYWSDRIPETLGRGGFLIHPVVPGIEDWYTDGRHLLLYDLGDWKQLFGLIDHALDPKNDPWRKEVADNAMELVRTRDTYRHRMESLITHLYETGLLRDRSLKDRGGRVTVRDRGASATFDLREGSSDGGIVDEVWRENVYRLDPADVTGGVVVDLGANVGAFSLWALAHGAATVVAHEPEQENFGRLIKNLELNPTLPSGHTRRTAVLDGPRKVAMVRGRPGHEGGAHVHDGGEVADLDQPLQWVPAEEINDVLRNALELAHHAGSAPPEVALLKLDVEGSEYDIICSGLDDDLLRCIRRITMEFHPVEKMSEWANGRDYPNFGWMVEKLAEHGHVEVLGRPSVGGYIYWRRYGP